MYTTVQQYLSQYKNINLSTKLIELCKEVGFSGPYLVTSRPIEAEPELKKSLGRFIRGRVPK